jgi:hypothetical protein
MSTFLTNLFSRAAHFRAPQKDWLAEYYHGALQQVFPVLLSKAVLGLRFEQVGSGGVGFAIGGKQRWEEGEE